MATREIIKIDEEKCNGCGLCIPNCPEGALQIIDEKARLVSDLFCDGLGACIGHCPEEAIIIEERDAQEYNEKKVMENIVKQGEKVIKAHLEHLREHDQGEYLTEAIEYLNEKGIKNPLNGSPAGYPQSRGYDASASSGCPGAKVMDFKENDEEIAEEQEIASSPGVSQLKQWPIQIKLVPPNAPYFRGSDLLISADCVPFAYADFHEDLLKGKVLLVGCPKLDDVELYREKLTHVFKENDIKSVVYAHMEVPCCFGLVEIIQSVISASGKEVPFEEITIGVKGGKLT